MKFVVIGAEGCQASSFVGLLDFLTLARIAIQVRLGGEPAFDVVAASRQGRDIADGRGRFLRADMSLEDVGASAALFVPGFAPDDRLQPPDISGLDVEADWIQRQHAQGALACASCGGAYLLGQARLLDDRRCTTAWWLRDDMHRRFPKVQAVQDRPLVDDRGVVTAASPLSWVSLALYAVRKICGTEAARIAGDFAIVDTLPFGMAAHAPGIQVDTANAFVRQAERAIRCARGVRLGVRELAQQLAMSQRTLHRRLTSATGESVKQFIDRVRVEVAQASLEADQMKVKQIAFDAGFDDEASFRRVFKRIAGTTPGVYRELARLERARREL